MLSAMAGTSCEEGVDLSRNIDTRRIFSRHGYLASSGVGSAGNKTGVKKHRGRYRPRGAKNGTYGGSWD